jgi:hypothetical protein
MFALLHSLTMFAIDFFKPRRRLEDVFGCAAVTGPCWSG